MDGIDQRFAKEIAAAIVRAAAGDGRVHAWREMAHAAGFTVTLPTEAALVSALEFTPLGSNEAQVPLAPSPPSFDLTPDDIRLLKILRIGVERAQCA
jgi:hypothetical protein